MTGLVLGLVTWIFTTVQRVDKQIALAGYRVDAAWLRDTFRPRLSPTATTRYMAKSER